MAMIPVVINIPEKLWADFCIYMEDCRCGLRGGEIHVAHMIRDLMINRAKDDMINEIQDVIQKMSLPDVLRILMATSSGISMDDLERADMPDVIKDMKRRVDTKVEEWGS